MVARRLWLRALLANWEPSVRAGALTKIRRRGWTTRRAAPVTRWIQQTSQLLWVQKSSVIVITAFVNYLQIGSEVRRYIYSPRVHKVSKALSFCGTPARPLVEDIPISVEAQARQTAWYLTIHMISVFCIITCIIHLHLRQPT
jgi:hypothetical protein